MSIASAISAEVDNKIKEKWTKLLREAFEARDWKAMDDAIRIIEAFEWVE